MQSSPLIPVPSLQSSPLFVVGIVSFLCFAAGQIGPSLSSGSDQIARLEAPQTVLPWVQMDSSRPLYALVHRIVSSLIFATLIVTYQPACLRLIDPSLGFAEPPSHLLALFQIVPSQGFVPSFAPFL